MELPQSPEQLHPLDDQNTRYLVTIIAFAVLVALASWVLYVRFGTIPTSIPPYDLFILTLATFRLIRLFTYDQIMRVVRDCFVDKVLITNEDGSVSVKRIKVQNGGRRSLGDLLSCPWCMGIWISFFMVFLYFMFPAVHYFALVLALAGLGSFIQIIANGIGAKAEFYKRENTLHN